MFVRQTNFPSWLHTINSPTLKRNKNTFHLYFWRLQKNYGKKKSNSHYFIHSDSQTHWSPVFGYTVRIHELQDLVFGSHTKNFFGGKKVKVKFFPSVRLSDVLIMQIGNKRVETSVPEFSVILSEFSGILPEYLTNQIFGGALSPPAPTNGYLCCLLMR